MFLRSDGKKQTTGFITGFEKVFGGVELFI